jgi:nitrogen fixation protein FixH
MTASRLTGRKMTGIFLAFFGVVIAVNMLMATIATRTFGGVVVENSYVASQKYNDWLAQSRRQDQLGWKVVPGVSTDRRVTVEVSVAGTKVDGVAKHPLGRLPDVPLRFHRFGDRFVSDAALPAGRWHVQLTIARGADRYRIVETLS